MVIHVIFRSNEKRSIFLEKISELRIHLAPDLISPGRGNEDGLAKPQERTCVCSASGFSQRQLLKV